MKRDLTVIKEKSWSLNLEDSDDQADIESVFAESIQAVRLTKAGYYVNLVTSGVHGDPRDWLIGPLQDRLTDDGLIVQEIRYIDECGCGGHVTRVYC